MKRILAVLLGGTLVLTSACVAHGMKPAPPEAPTPATIPVLLHLVQNLEEGPAHPRRGLRVWLANVDEAEPLREIKDDKADEDPATRGWIVWRLPPGEYALTLSAYASGGMPATTMFDRFRFTVPAPAPALYLGSLTYRCRKAMMFKAFCRSQGAFESDGTAARSIAARLGLPGPVTVPLRRGVDRGVMAAGAGWTEPQRLAPKETLVMVGEGKVVRMAYDFLSQADRQGQELASEMGLEVGHLLLEQGNGYDFIAALLVGSITQAIHGHRLQNKAECVARIFDEEAAKIATKALDEALRKAGAGQPKQGEGPPGTPIRDIGGRYRQLLALNVQRIEIDSCNPGTGRELLDPRGKRFCLQVAIRARLYRPGAPAPIRDEIYARVPANRVGHEYDGNAYPVPEPHEYETSLTHFPAIKRTYHEYCDKGGGEILAADLQEVIHQMVPNVLQHSGLTPGPGL